MDDLATRLKQRDYADRIFDDRQLADVLAGSDASRYGLVNRAIKAGALLRIKRGLYALKPGERSEGIHPFSVAQALMPGSYISLETALAHHGWIPEAAYTTASICPGRKTVEYHTGAFGLFSFHPLALAPYQFLAGVERSKFGKLTAFIATPLRALMDLVALRKTGWTGLTWLTEGLRIEDHNLLTLQPDQFSALKAVYKHEAARTFLASLEREVQVAARQVREKQPHD